MSVISDIISALTPRRRTRVYDKTEVTALGGYIEEYGIPVGTIITKLTDTDPGAGWLQVTGQTLSKAEYAELYAEIGGLFGETPTTFNLPDLSDTYLTGTGTLAVGASGGENTTNLSVSQLPSHNHTFTGTPHGHDVTDAGHTHTFTGTPHNHTITDPGHTHGDIIEPGSTFGFTGSGDADYPASTDSATTGITIDDATAGGTNSNETTGVTVDNTTAGGTVGSTGSGDDIDNRPKSLAMYYFIKVSV